MKSLLILALLCLLVVGCRSGCEIVRSEDVPSHVTVEEIRQDYRASIREGKEIGRVGVSGEVLSVRQTGAVSIAVRQSVVLCVQQEQKRVPLATAVVTPENGMLRLDVRNVPDEDGDLVAVTDGRQVQEFRKNAVEYVKRHHVVAVKTMFEGEKIK